MALVAVKKGNAAMALSTVAMAANPTAMPRQSVAGLPQSQGLYVPSTCAAPSLDSAARQPTFARKAVSLIAINRSLRLLQPTLRSELSATGRHGIRSVDADP